MPSISKAIMTTPLGHTKATSIISAFGSWAVSPGPDGPQSPEMILITTSPIGANRA